MPAGHGFNPGSGHIDQALTNLVRKYPRRFRFIADGPDGIANVVTVQKETDKFWTIDDMHLVSQKGRSLKAAGGESNSVEYSWNEDSYSCHEYALHAELPHRTRDNADSQLGLETEVAAVPRDGILLEREEMAADIFFSTTHMTNNGATAARWDDATASNIKAWDDILDGKRNVRKFGGADPSHIAMGDDSWTALAKYIMSQGSANNAVSWQGVREILKENPDAIPPMLLGLKLLVGSAVKSSAVKAANVSRAESGGNISDIWADKALVFHKGSPGLKSVQLAAQFMVRDNPRVRRGTYSDTRAADWFEYGELRDLKVIAAPLGFLLTNTIT